MVRMSRGMSASADATMIVAAAAYCAEEIPIALPSGPATSAPAGMAITEPRTSYDETRASLPGGMFRASATVHCTIIISTNTPRPNDATQTAGNGRTMASESGEMATAAPVSTTNSMGRRGVIRSDSTPPAIRPSASAAVIAPQAAGPPRCSLATTGPSTEKAPYQAISTTQNWATITHSQVCERNSDQPSRNSRNNPEDADSGVSAPYARARMDSNIGTVAAMPIPHSTSAQPGPAAATSRPAAAAPDICPVFMANRLIALASCSMPRGTTRGSSA